MHGEFPVKIFCLSIFEIQFNDSHAKNDTDYLTKLLLQFVFQKLKK